MTPEMNRIFEQLPEALLPWYQAGHRDLPWRQDREPYHIWLSEIMLQQTRVEAVRGYYARFLQALPDIEALANADDELLLKLWEGLGYYSRVRNLKKAAQLIQTEHGGIFPTDYKSVLALPGIGGYTAGAICSIAYNQPAPAVDGNVLRVVSRLTAYADPVDTPQYKAQVNQVLATVYPAEAGEFTQALMELGATICGPNRLPECHHCPCGAFCLGYRCGIAPTLPAKLPKRKRTEEDLTVFLIRCDGNVALQKRPGQGLLAGLWQFPNVPGTLSLEDAMRSLEAMGLRPVNVEKQLDRKHIFTHIQWNMRCYYLDVAELLPDFTWLTPEQVTASTALPTAFRQFWEAPVSEN